MSLAPAHTDKTHLDDTADRNKDRLIHLICAGQQVAPGSIVTTMCGHTFIPKTSGPVDGLKGLRCIVCEELRQAKRCIHCERQNRGGN